MSGQRPQRRRRVEVSVGLVLIGLFVPTIVLAHQPTPGTKIWSTTEVAAGSTFKWAANVPSWLKTSVSDVLETEWGDIGSNNSQDIRFAYDASGSATVYFQDTTGVTACDSVTGWQGCANGGGTVGWHMWIRANPTYYDWCELSNTTGCRLAARVAIHEAGHVGGIQHYSASESYTVMTTAAPANPSSGWSTSHLQPCDEARLQLLYDPATLSGAYSTCLDDLANSGPNGLVTDLSVPSYTVCANVSATVTGRLNVHDYDDYLVLGNNNVAGRTVWIDRGATPKYTSATTTGVNGTSNNWSKTFAAASNITINYVAHYDRPSGEGLESSPDRAFSVTWLSPQVGC